MTLKTGEKKEKMWGICKEKRCNWGWWSCIALSFSQCLLLLLFQQVLIYIHISCSAKRRHRKALFSNRWHPRWLCHLLFTQETDRQSPTCNQVPHTCLYSLSHMRWPSVSSDWLLVVPTQKSTWMLLKETCIIQWDTAQTLNWAKRVQEMHRSGKSVLMGVHIKTEPSTVV